MPPCIPSALSCISALPLLRFFHPKYVWTPVGGWWHDKPATHDVAWPLVMAAYGLALLTLFKVSTEREVCVAGSCIV